MFLLQEDPIDLNVVRLSHNNPSNGALVSFEGIVRKDDFKDSKVSALLYVADKPSCLSEGQLIIQDTLSLFPINHAVCIQRIGKVNAEETAIWIGVWAGHRDEAFKGCRYIIEEVKKRLVIWKKELYADGTSRWIHGAETINLR